MGRDRRKIRAKKAKPRPQAPKPKPKPPRTMDAAKMARMATYAHYPISAATSSISFSGGYARDQVPPYAFPPAGASYLRG